MFDMGLYGRIRQKFREHKKHIQEHRQGFSHGRNHEPIPRHSRQIVNPLQEHPRPTLLHNGLSNGATLGDKVINVAVPVARAAAKSSSMMITTITVSSPVVDELYKEQHSSTQDVQSEIKLDAPISLMPKLPEPDVTQAINPYRDITDSKTVKIPTPEPKTILDTADTVVVQPKIPAVETRDDEGRQQLIASSSFVLQPIRFASSNAEVKPKGHAMNESLDLEDFVMKYG